MISGPIPPRTTNVVTPEQRTIVSENPTLPARQVAILTGLTPLHIKQLRKDDKRRKDVAEHALQSQKNQIKDKIVESYARCVEIVNNAVDTANNALETVRFLVPKHYEASSRILGKIFVLYLRFSC